MPGDRQSGCDGAEVPRDTLLLLNRAGIVRHLVRTAAHELNNAMQLVSGSAEMLGSMPDLPVRAAGRVEAILRQLARCRSVVDALSAAARIEAPGSPSVDVRGGLEQVLEMRRYRAHPRGS